MEQNVNASGQEFSLASLLNILWRRRLVVLGLPLLGLIVGLLYGTLGTKRWSATATVRPGITSFSPDGAPWRQWQLKDITTWFDKQLYQQDLTARLGLDPEFRPVIRTEFIATGLTNLAGGEVVTLWTTGTSPELARAILDTAMVLFMEYAEADPVSSQLKLTRDGLNLKVRILENQLLGVDKREVALELALKTVQAESLVVAVLDQELGIEIDMLGKRTDFFTARLAKLQIALPGLDKELDQIYRMMNQVTAAGDSGQVEAPDWARTSATLKGGDLLNQLSATRHRIEAARAFNFAMQDSFTYGLEVTRLEREKRILHRAATVQVKLRDIERRMGDIFLERDFDLIAKRLDIQADIEGRQIQLRTLSPLQYVGRTVVSDKPVRPRGQRATMILVFLGLVGGFVLGFVWDYLAHNRRQIFKS